MLLTVNRFTSDSEATLSTVSIDGVFECFGLEDEHRIDKVPGETRIPSGFYSVRLRAVGGFHANYSGRFPDIHQGMLQVMDVPGFEFILIHVGNTDEDTAGCLLVGCNANTSQGLSVGSSVKAYKRLYSRVIEAAKADQLTIQYWDND
tara:strand:- start:366 stop:809 length:444 start_codon:yes stop_codon:yes gene_type:complete